MTFVEIVQLFEEAPVMTLVLALFIFNTTITVGEIAYDALVRKKRRWRDTGANFVIYLMGQVLESIGMSALSLVFLLPFQYLTPIAIPNTWWAWALALVLADLTYYWMHRLEHEHRWLWALHSVHHSSEDYNLSIAWRLSLVEGLIDWIFLVPMILLGFSPFMTIVSITLVVQYQQWIHTERVGKLGWLDGWLNTPSVHRVHHASNPQYLDKNYGGVLMVWDRLFGTYEPEVEQPKYGLTKNIKTNNPLKINFIEFRNIWRDAKQCRNWRDKWRIIFGGLTWRPAYFQQPAQEKQEEAKVAA